MLAPTPSASAHPDEEVEVERAEEDAEKENGEYGVRELTDEMNNSPINPSQARDPIQDLTANC